MVNFILLKFSKSSLLTWAYKTGMTETSLCHSVTTDFDKNKSFQKAFESIGRPLPFTETKITDPANGQIVPLGTDGELLIRGPHIIKEYWDDKEKTAEAFDKNGW